MPFKEVVFNAELGVSKRHCEVKFLMALLELQYYAYDKVKCLLILR